jgi:hypothetical protein
MIPVIISLPQLLFSLSLIALIAGQSAIGRLKFACVLGLAGIAVSIAEWLS